MPKPLKPADFPIAADRNKLVTDQGAEVAEATSPLSPRISQSA